MHDKHLLLETLQKSLDDAQANDIITIDVSNQTTVTDFMIVCSGRSSRHVKAIAQQIMEQMKAAGMPALSYHGLASGEWALIDFGDFVVHVMQPESRAFYSVNQFVKQMKGCSYASLADTRHMLNRCMKDLHELGFKVSHLKGLKSKHAYILVEHWKKQGKNPATIKNYMAKLRKTADLLDKPKLIKKGYDSYQIDKRSYAPTHNKAIHHLDLSRCTDPYIRLSLEAQMLFGLRREESLKFIWSQAWRGDSLFIKPSWTKGGIGRVIDITNEMQKAWLVKVSQQVPQKASLIPKERSYKQHLSHYQQQANKMGVCKLHGLRHAYAQRRYEEITKQLAPLKKGLICPVAGGKPPVELNAAEKTIDLKAREIISRELGHSRLNITKTYLG